MSFRIQIDRRQLKASRFIARVIRAFQDAYEAESDKHGLTRASMARELNVERSVISRRLTGQANLTLRSIAEMADVLNRDIRFDLIERKEIAGNGNHTARTTEAGVMVGRVTTSPPSLGAPLGGPAPIAASSPISQINVELTA